MNTKDWLRDLERDQPAHQRSDQPRIALELGRTDGVPDSAERRTGALLDPRHARGRRRVSRSRLDGAGVNDWLIRASHGWVEPIPPPFRCGSPNRWPACTRGTSAPSVRQHQVHGPGRSRAQRRHPVLPTLRATSSGSQASETKELLDGVDIETVSVCSHAHCARCDVRYRQGLTRATEYPQPGRIARLTVQRGWIEELQPAPVMPRSPATIEFRWEVPQHLQALAAQEVDR